MLSKVMSLDYTVEDSGFCG